MELCNIINRMVNMTRGNSIVIPALARAHIFTNIWPPWSLWLDSKIIRQVSFSPTKVFVGTWYWYANLVVTSLGGWVFSLKYQNISRFIVKTTHPKSPPNQWRFLCFNIFSSFSFLLFSAPVQLSSLCFSHILKPESYQPNEVTCANFSPLILLVYVDMLVVAMLDLGLSVHQPSPCLHA